MIPQKLAIRDGAIAKVDRKASCHQHGFADTHIVQCQVNREIIIPVCQRFSQVILSFSFFSLLGLGGP